MKSIYKFSIYLVLALVISASGCKKLVEVDPPKTSLTGNNVYTSNSTAAGVLTSIYDNMSKGSFATGSTGISLEAGLSSDELLLGSNVGDVTLAQFAQNALVSSNITFWNDLYNDIHTANLAVEGLAASKGLAPALVQQLTGEAKFMRAFLHFYAVSCYGDVPLVNTSNYQVNKVIARSPKDLVYRQIITDLLDAQKLLSSNYLAADALTTSTDRVRPSRWAATALLARVYLYTGDYINAEVQASMLIDNASFKLAPLNNAFLKTSPEAIWQLMPVIPNANTLDGNVFIINTDLSPDNPVYLSDNLLNAFESGDGRRTSWVDSYNTGTQTYFFPNKYKIKTSATAPTEYLMVLRLGEQYLIRAEARAQQENIGGATGALADINAIRARAGLAPYAGANDKASVLAAILHERQVELFTEWGHRWFDLKRTNMADAVMSIVAPQKGGVWNTNKQLYPIPIYDIQADPNLVQNPGY